MLAISQRQSNTHVNDKTSQQKSTYGVMFGSCNHYGWLKGKIFKNDKFISIHNGC